MIELLSFISLSRLGQAVRFLIKLQANPKPKCGLEFSVGNEVVSQR